MTARFWIISLGALALAGCSARDPIDGIVREDSADPYFPNGLFPIINLPSTAPVVEVAAKALGLAATNVSVLETRQVHIAYGNEGKTAFSEDSRYTAVLVNTGSGRKVVLLQFERGNRQAPSNWWSRIYDLQ